MRPIIAGAALMTCLPALTARAANELSRYRGIADIEQAEPMSSRLPSR